MSDNERQIELRKKHVLTGEELFELNEEPDKYLIEDILWENDNVILLAKEKVGKSIFSLQMACSLSCGESFLDKFEIPEPMEVFYVQTESTRSDTIQRLKAMTSKSGIGWNPKKFYLMTEYGLALDREDGYKYLKHEIDKIGMKPKVIFIDPLYMSMVGSLIDDQVSRATMKNLRRLNFDYGSAILVVHHEHRPRKSKEGNIINEGDNAIMGSFVWKAFPSHILHLKMMQNKIRVLKCQTQRSNRVMEDLKLDLIQPFPLFYRIHGESDSSQFTGQVLNWLERKGRKHTKQIAEETGINESSVKKSLSYLVRNHRIKKVNPGERPTYYQAVMEDLIPERKEIENADRLF